MKRMFLALSALLVFALVLGACRSTAESGEGGGNGDSACSADSAGGNDFDMAAMLIDQYVKGDQKAAPWVALHSVVNVGQLWEVTSSFGGQKSVSKWQVSAKVQGTKSEFIVENDTGMGYILAYQVDAWVEQGNPNVSNAWIGKPGEEPREIQVMEWKSADGGEARPAGIVLVEEFGGVELCGETFHGDLTIVKNDGNTTKTWIAENGWFNRLIKMEMNGDTVMELTNLHFHEKPKTFLKWE